jgi:dienelactone hydrolase
MVTLTADWLWKAISKARANEKQIVLIGYSMGGACAEIVADKMENVSDLKLYLFGAPKGLNRRRQNELYNRVSVFRFYNRWDVVPYLPIRWAQSKKCTRVFLPKHGHKWENYRERYEELLRDLKEAKVSAY